MHDALLEQLGNGKYLLVTSYKKDGTPVPTPVWVVRDGASLGVWTVADSWKAKRIRRRPDVLVGPCDVRGQATGDPVPATAELVDPAPYRRLLARKYGLVGRLVMLGSRLRRGADGMVGIRITLTD
ncbi:PPOX class F420-dependent oxidoreductase [Kitasatospora viridis]|uniref:Uncharacterized protein n=1 Tax=Kitasatospora viridis TaxID=281105 RepID=A0A561UMR9_9ACTN|nr:PPOX class F420-dependent oxidoreductase [Kitasatospora viridis]TWG00663.1 hypothetical protein FHX73_114543 [Kitasatospora viridis]